MEKRKEQVLPTLLPGNVVGKPRISIIVSTYNQLSYVKYNLKAYRWVYDNQFQDFEIIFADDGSKDGTDKYIEEITTRQIFPFPVQCVWHEDRGFRRALIQNKAIEEARGQYVLIMDVDTFPGEMTFPPLLEKISRPFVELKEAYMGIRWKVNWEKLKDKPYSLENIHRSIIKAKDFRGWIRNIPPAPYYTFSGVNVLFNRIRFIAMGGNPQSFNGFGYEDYYIALKWLGEGGTITALNDSICFHVDHSNTEGGLDNYLKLRELEGRLLRRVKQMFPDYNDAPYPDRRETRPA